MARQVGQSAPPSHSLEPSLAAGFLLLSLPIGAFWFVVLVAFIPVDGVLATPWVGIPILALAMMLCVAGTGARGSKA